MTAWHGGHLNGKLGACLGSTYGAENRSKARSTTLPRFMTWDWSICLWPGWLLGLMGMLAAGFRIIPPWSVLFMALAVAAQVTRTELCGAHSPDGMVGRAALLPIIPEGKPEKTETCRNWKHTHHVWTPHNLTLSEITSLQYAASPTAKALTGTDVGRWLRNKNYYKVFYNTDLPLFIVRKSC